ncbi:MAG: hypothetical protein ACRDLA_18090 [Thermoleophilaceae bacterium]
MSIAEDLAQYAADRATRESSSVSEVVNEGLRALRARERNRIAAMAYARDNGEATAWSESALPLFWEVVADEDAGW